MLKLLEILQNIYLDKLMFKSTEFKLGFQKAIDIVKIHGFQTEIIHETKQLRIELEQSQKSLEFLKSRLELEREEVSLLTAKLNNQTVTLNRLNENAYVKADKHLRVIAKKLNKTNMDSDKKVAVILSYIDFINKTKEKYGIKT